MAVSVEWAADRLTADRLTADQVAGILPHIIHYLFAYSVAV